MKLNVFIYPLCREAQHANRANTGCPNVRGKNHPSDIGNELLDVVVNVGSGKATPVKYPDRGPCRRVGRCPLVNFKANID